MRVLYTHSASCRRSCCKICRKRIDNIAIQSWRALRLALALILPLPPETKQSSPRAFGHSIELSRVNGVISSRGGGNGSASFCTRVNTGFEDPQIQGALLARFRSGLQPPPTCCCKAMSCSKICGTREVPLGSPPPAGISKNADFDYRPVRRVSAMAYHWVNITRHVTLQN